MSQQTKKLRNSKKNTAIKIKTSRFGELTVKKNTLIYFPEGIYGFEYAKEYILLEHYKEGSPFKWLQAVKEPDLAFVIINPVDFIPDYTIQLTEEDCKFIQLKDSSDFALMTIVTIPGNEPQKLTANFKAPLIVNVSSKIGRQIILEDEKYLIKQPLFLEEIVPSQK